MAVMAVVKEEEMFANAWGTQCRLYRWTAHVYSMTMSNGSMVCGFRLLTLQPSGPRMICTARRCIFLL